MAFAVRVTSTAPLRRPYSIGFVDVREAYTTPPGSGFDKHYDIQVRLSEGWPRLICSLAWSEDRKLIRGTVQVETKITNAEVRVYTSGVSWRKVEEIDGFSGTSIHWNDRVITFQKRIRLESSVKPLLEKIPFLKDLDVTNSFLMEIKGTFDVVSRVGMAEMR